MESKQEQSPEPISIQDFLAPLPTIDNRTMIKLSREMVQNFQQLSAQSSDQFLPTPISESLLRHIDGADRGR